MRRGAVGAVVALAVGVTVASLTGGAQAALPCGLLFPCPTTSTTTATVTSPTPTPPQQPPQPADAGASYYGRANDAHYIVSVGVTKDGAHISYGSFGYTAGRCNNGLRYSSGDYVSLHGVTKMRGGAIRGDGLTSFSILYKHAWDYDGHGHKVYGPERFAVSMHFAGKIAHGTLTDRFKSGGLRCASGPLRFTVWRGGTPQAPLRTASVRTGRYAGRSDYGDSMTLNVSSPLRLLIRARIRFAGPKLTCTGGASWRKGEPTWLVFNTPLHGGRFSMRGHNHYGANGYTNSDTIGLSGTLHGSTANAVWRFKAVIRYHGRYVGVCETDPNGGDQFTLYWHAH